MTPEPSPPHVLAPTPTPLSPPAVRSIPPPHQLPPLRTARAPEQAAVHSRPRENRPPAIRARENPPCRHPPPPRRVPPPPRTLAPPQAPPPPPAASPPPAAESAKVLFIESLPASVFVMDSKGIQKFREPQAKFTAVSSGRRVEPPKSHKAQKATPVSTVLDGVEAPAFLKFSEDTACHQRIQKILTIRDSSAGWQAKTVIDLLEKNRQTFTAEQIYDACYVNINHNSGVLEILRNNYKVDYDGKHFKYKPKHSLKGRDDFLSLIQKCPDGLLVGDVEDAYFSVKEDIQTLKASGLVWLFSSTDWKEEVVFFNDPKLNIKVDPYLKQIFRKIELPDDFLKIEGELKRSGLKPASNTALRRATSGLQGIVSKPKHKSKKQRKIRYKNITNTHRMDLLM